MAKVLCISSQVVWGPVGNSAAVPALQAEGHDVLQAPTVLLSHHPGHGTPTVHPISGQALAALLQSVEDRGALADCAGVMTGYFADASQVEAVERLIRRLRSRNPALAILVDPVIGDHGKTYVPIPVAEAIRDLLLPCATIATPNAFELGWLTGRPVSNCAEATIAAAEIPCPEMLITSVPMENQQLGTLLLQQDQSRLISTAKRHGVPHGTGDFLAGCYFAHRLNTSPVQAFERAMVRLKDVMDKSGDARTLQVC